MTKRVMFLGIVGLAIGIASAMVTQGSTVEAWVPSEMVGQILKDPKLTEYFHLGVPGRESVQLLDVLLPPDLEELALGFPTMRVKAQAPEAATAFRFTRLDVGERKASVEFAYPKEGIQGRYMFVWKKERWILRDRRITEN